MEFDFNVLTNTEKVVFALRSLYTKNGYALYKMSKFEEYDLYSTKKDFLVSDQVITFTDTSGKLMALKPDVTLSIVKNYKDGDGLAKVCYDENVYRVSKGSNSYKELLQTGIECIGNVTTDDINGVLSLALKSLELVSPSYLLTVSSLDLLKACIKKITDSRDEINEIIALADEKNIHGIKSKYPENNEYLLKLLRISSAPSVCMDEIETIAKDVNAYDSFLKLKEAVKGLDEKKVVIDFSVSADISYYNGIIFKGYVEGVPSAVLSGGQYDKLMKKMKKKATSIGFAVYLDLLEFMLES